MSSTPPSIANVRQKQETNIEVVGVMRVLHAKGKKSDINSLWTCGWTCKEHDAGISLV